MELDPTTGRTPFGPTIHGKNFIVTFKAGMLLKTHESRTKYANPEQPFRRKCRAFALFPHRLVTIFGIQDAAFYYSDLLLSFFAHAMEGQSAPQGF